MSQIVVEYREDDLILNVRAIQRAVIRNFSVLLSLLHSPDWKYYFMPSERERLLSLSYKG